MPLIEKKKKNRLSSAVNGVQTPQTPVQTLDTPNDSNPTLGLELPANNLALDALRSGLGGKALEIPFSNRSQNQPLDSANFAPQKASVSSGGIQRSIRLPANQLPARNEAIASQSGSPVMAEVLYLSKNEESLGNAFRMVDVDRIRLGDTVRQTPDPKRLSELAASISALRDARGGIGGTGLIEPILVRPEVLGDGSVLHGSYILVKGLRRLLAAKEAYLSQVPVQVQSLSGEEARLTGLLTHLMSEPATLLEKSAAVVGLLQDGGFTIRSLASTLGVGSSTIMRCVQLDGMPSELKDARQKAKELGAGELAEHLIVIRSIEDRDLRKRMVRELLEPQDAPKRLNLAEVRHIAKGIKFTDALHKAGQIDLTAKLFLQNNIVASRLDEIQWRRLVDQRMGRLQGKDAREDESRQTQIAHALNVADEEQNDGEAALSEQTPMARLVMQSQTQARALAPLPMIVDWAKGETANPTAPDPTVPDPTTQTQIFERETGWKQESDWEETETPVLFQTSPFASDLLASLKTVATEVAGLRRLVHAWQEVQESGTLVFDTNHPVALQALGEVESLESLVGELKNLLLD